MGGKPFGFCCFVLVMIVFVDVIFRESLELRFIREFMLICYLKSEIFYFYFLIKMEAWCFIFLLFCVFGLIGREMHFVSIRECRIGGVIMKVDPLL